MSVGKGKYVILESKLVNAIRDVPRSTWELSAQLHLASSTVQTRMKRLEGRGCVKKSGKFWVFVPQASRDNSILEKVEPTRLKGLGLGKKWQSIHVRP